MPTKTTSLALSRVCAWLFAFSALLCAQSIPRRAVLLISIDGMHPSYVLGAEKHGLNLPVLSKFVQQGTYAESVLNVTPTVTYPNHTTLVTGVLPAEHGILSNTVFDPFGKEQGAWNWYAAQVRAPTLWQAAKARGLITASVLWPVTVHATSIDYNVPEFWRNKREFDHYLMEAVSTPSGFLEKVEETAGFFYSGDGDVVLDEKITKAAISMIEKGRPHLTTVHLVALDHVMHGTGPFSKEAKQTLEVIDGMVGRMMAAQLKVNPNATIMVVSDHGFYPVHHKVNLNVALVNAGLVTVSDGPRPQVTSWKAYVWSADGSASVVLADENDSATRTQLDRLLTQLAADPANGIGRVLRGPEAAANGALPGSAFQIDFCSGYSMSPGVVGALVRDTPSAVGTHGYFNTHPDLNAAFFVAGRGIAAGRNLGRIDMRQIAPTIARELSISLPSAKMQSLSIRDESRQPSGVRMRKVTTE